MSKLYRKKFILDNELYFPENMIYEDNYWMAKCMIFTKHIYVIDEAMYIYYMNDNSTVGTTNSMCHLDRMKIEEMILELAKKENVFDAFYREFEIRFIQQYFCSTWYAIFIKMDSIPEVLPMMRERILKEFPDYKNNPYLKERLHPLYYAILSLLDEEKVYTVDELEYVKKAFIQSVDAL